MREGVSYTTKATVLWWSEPAPVRSTYKYLEVHVR